MNKSILNKKIFKYNSKIKTILNGGFFGKNLLECTISAHKNISEKINNCLIKQPNKKHPLFNMEEFMFVTSTSEIFYNTTNIGFNYLIAKEDGINIKFINIYTPELDSITKITSDEHCQFFSPTKGIIEFHHDITAENNVRIVNNWEKIKIGHVIRIWVLLNKNKIKSHLVAEIILDRYTSISFGISNLDEIDVKFQLYETRIATQEAILLSPDPMLNEQLQRQYNDPLNTYCEIVSQGIITEKSYEKLQNFFKFFNPYTNCIGVQLMHNIYDYNKRFININKIKDKYLEIKKVIGKTYEELSNIPDLFSYDPKLKDDIIFYKKNIQYDFLFYEPENKDIYDNICIKSNTINEHILNTVYTKYKDLSELYNLKDTKYDIFNTYNLIYCWKYTEAEYFKLSGKLPDIISSNKKLVNCTSIINWLFEDIVNCSIGGIAHPSHCTPSNVTLKCSDNGEPNEVLEFNKKILNYNYKCDK